MATLGSISAVTPSTHHSAPSALTESLVLIGGGGHALVVAEAAIMLGFHLPGYFDDHPLPALGQGPSPIIALGRLKDIVRIAGRPWILAIGNLDLRRALLGQVDLVGPGPGRDAPNARTVIHPTAIISPSARIGHGVFVGPGAVIHSRAVIEDHAIINSAAIVEHECRIGSNTHVAPGAILAGGVRVGRDTLIGIGVRTLPTLTIGEGCIVGAGAVVTRSIPDRHRAKGIPARSNPVNKSSSAPFGSVVDAFPDVPASGDEFVGS